MPSINNWLRMKHNWMNTTTSVINIYQIRYEGRNLSKSNSFTLFLSFNQQLNFLMLMSISHFRLLAVESSKLSHICIQCKSRFKQKWAFQTSEDWEEFVEEGEKQHTNLWQLKYDVTVEATGNPLPYCTDTESQRHREREWVGQTLWACWYL